MDEDIMSKVMKRQLGGGSSSCESSPEKQHHMASLDNGSCVSFNVNQEIVTPLISSSGLSPESIQEQKIESAGIDEIDGFTENQIKHGHSVDNEYVHNNFKTNGYSLDKQYRHNADSVYGYSLDSKYKCSVDTKCGQRINNQSRRHVDNEYGHSIDFKHGPNIDNKHRNNDCVETLENATFITTLQDGVKEWDLDSFSPTVPNCEPIAGNCNTRIRHELNLPNQNSNDGESDSDIEEITIKHNANSEDVVGKYHENTEYNLEIDNGTCSTPIEPHVDMFNESDSNSGSNPFVVTTFQSLNSDSVAKPDKHLTHVDIEDFSYTEIEEKTIAENKSCQHEHDKSNDMSSSENDMSSSENDMFSYANATESEEKSRRSNYDGGIIKPKNSSTWSHKKSYKQLNTNDRVHHNANAVRECKQRRSDETIVVPEILEIESQELIGTRSVEFIESELDRSDDLYWYKCAGQSTGKCVGDISAGKRSEKTFCCAEERSEKFDIVDSDSRVKVEDRKASFERFMGNEPEIDGHENGAKETKTEHLFTDGASKLNELTKQLSETNSRIADKVWTKKSRKQNVPKRVRKLEIDHIHDEGTESIADAEHNPQSGKTVKNEISEKIRQDKGELNQKASDIIVWKDKDESEDEYDTVEHRKSEKSRKQCKPQRITTLASINDQTAVNTEKEGQQLSEGGNELKVKREPMNEGTYSSELKVKRERMDEGTYGNEIKVDTNHDGVFASSKKDIKDSDANHKGSETNFIETKINSEGVNEVHCAWPSMKNETKTNQLPSLNSSPYHYELPPHLMSNLTPELLQNAGTCTSGHFALNENGPENLEVIRQLREIRCNRYRKISMVEKREIAGYANAHGVSHAAAYYNVSKSAVSMWTKLDFSKVDDDTGKKNKNCMIGNEKFEALCLKVKCERENKFKGMTKQDKFEVSRYAKLVGVREMARCLDVALGTVSGWMRQFPYKVESVISDTRSADGTGINTDQQHSSDLLIGTNNTTENTISANSNDKSSKRRKSNQNSNSTKKQRVSDSMTTDDVDSYRTVQQGNTVFILPGIKTEIDDYCSTHYSHNDGNSTQINENLSENLAKKFDSSLEQQDELDKMIAETLQKPDAEKCFDNVKELINGSLLDGDDFFRSLFDRVISCRADKYKSLKPSEKLEVVRYAKRVGVRRVAKILGLATGTLSGWNTKFQSCLGITDPNLDMADQSDLLVSFLSPSKDVETELNNGYGASPSVAALPGAGLDNPEKSEVTAVRLLFKDRYTIMLKKIEIAKQMKFRNISTDEKIEFVKCSKLVGIRPTARVFSIPIGTLSGWITKYSKVLHPAYHVEVDQDITSSSQECYSQTYTGLCNPGMVGRNATPVIPLFQDGTSASPGWSQIAGLMPSVPGPALKMLSPLQNMPSSSQACFTPSLPTSSQACYAPSLPTESLFHNRDHSNSTESGIKMSGFQCNKHLETSLSVMSDDAKQSVDVNTKICTGIQQMENRSGSLLNVKTEAEETVPQSGSVDMTMNNFDQEARFMAQKYLTAAYQQMGIPIG